jgi:hypothetical protein
MTWADTSHYQAVDLGAYFAAHDRLAQKVTEGGWDHTQNRPVYVDPTFASRYAYCRDRRLPFVAYHFDRARFDGAEQFDTMLWAIRQAGGPRAGLDLLCLDSEDTQTPGRAAASAHEFTGRATALGFPAGAVYSGVWFASPYGIVPSLLPPGWRRLWLSDYNAAHTDATMALPFGWTRDQVIARQYTSTATVAGVSGPCDANRTLIDWLQEDDVTAAEVWAERLAVPAALDADYSAPSYTAADVIYGANVFGARAAKVLARLEKAQAAESAALTALAGLVAAGTNDLTAADVKAAVAQALAEGTVSVDVSVHGDLAPVTP